MYSVMMKKNNRGGVRLEASSQMIRKFEYENSSLGKNTVFKQHYHNFFEVYFLEEGECHFFIGSGTYEVKPGDLVLIPEGTIHNTMYGDAEHFRRLFYCDTSYIPTGVLHRLDELLYVYRNKKLTPKIREIFEVIERESAAPDEFSQEIIMDQVRLLFFLLARHPDTEHPKNSTNAYAAATVSYIKENYAEELSLDALAARCAVRPEHLSRIFKRETGFGVSEYITMIRLQRAQLLLRSSPALSVTAIAALCGFNDSNYFSNRFKQTYGVSPLAYRRTQG